jgi:hypothetical protein
MAGVTSMEITGAQKLIADGKTIFASGDIGAWGSSVGSNTFER